MGDAVLKRYAADKRLLPVGIVADVAYFVVLSPHIGKLKTDFGTLGSRDVRTFSDTRTAATLEAAKSRTEIILQTMAAVKKPEASKGRSMRIITIANSTYDEHQTRLGEFALTGGIYKIGGDDLVHTYIVPGDFLHTLYTEIGSLGINSIDLPGLFEDFSDAKKAAEKQLASKPMGMPVVVKSPIYKIMYVANDVVEHIGKKHFTEISSVYDVEHNKDIVGDGAKYFVIRSDEIEKAREVVQSRMPLKDIHILDIMDAKGRKDLDAAREAAKIQLNTVPKVHRPPQPAQASPARPAQRAGRRGASSQNNVHVSGGPQGGGPMSGPGRNAPIPPGP